MAERKTTSRLTEMEGYHTSVLSKEVIEALDVKAGDFYVDCTLGDGGHSLEILKRGGKVTGIDVDPLALKRAWERFRIEGITEGARVIQGNFRDIKNLISRREIVPRFIQQTDTAKTKFAGAIFDLGVSSLQIETPERGFSFGKNGPLDMRMDPTLSVLALDLIYALTGKELYELFKKLGQEKYSKRVAGALVRAREIGELKTTYDLANLVAGAVGRAGAREKIHPATRIFQALRIAVNDELAALKEGLSEVKDLIEKNGHIVVISFHSLEDRIVKNTFREWESQGFGKVLTKKPVVPGAEEIRANPRSRSAKMRVIKIF